MTIRGLRQRAEIYGRRRWTDPHLREVEVAFMGAALLISLMMVLMVCGGRG
jgi:hypothetical protein